MKFQVTFSAYAEIGAPNKDQAEEVFSYEAERMGLFDVDIRDIEVIDYED